MRKFLSVFLPAAIVLAFTACNNKLNILAPYKDIPVVYGLMDQSDTIHYIRLNKAYEGNGDAYAMAKQYDSINYPVNIIKVQLIDVGINDTVLLDTTSSIPLSAGIFSYPKQVLYYTKKALNLNDQYKLVITNSKTKNVATAYTGLLPDVTPYVGSSTQSFMVTSPIALALSNKFLPTKITWTSNAQAPIYQLAMRFYYNEIDTINKDSVHKYADWIFPTQTTPSLEAGYGMSVSYAGGDFMQFVKGTIPPPTGFNKRVPLYIEVMFTTGSSDLNTYILLSQPSQNVNQEKPFFTDVKNGIGIFSSRHLQTVIRPLATPTIDSLVNSPTTFGLNFKAQ